MLGQTNEKILWNSLQRQLRKEMTLAERQLWQALRNRQMCGLKFRRQHPFADFILDFVCLEKRLVIEVDGGQHAARTEYDEARTERLRSAGFMVLRFWNNEVLEELEAVKERIRFVVEDVLGLESHPHPDPPLEGEGELGIVLLKERDK